VITTRATAGNITRIATGTARIAFTGATGITRIASGNTESVKELLQSLTRPIEKVTELLSTVASSTRIAGTVAGTASGVTRIARTIAGSASGVARIASNVAGPAWIAIGVAGATQFAECLEKFRECKLATGNATIVARAANIVARIAYSITRIAGRVTRIACLGGEERTEATAKRKHVTATVATDIVASTTRIASDLVTWGTGDDRVAWPTLAGNTRAGSDKPLQA